MSLLLIDTTKVEELARLYWESRHHPEDRARWECIGAEAEKFLVGNMARFLDALTAQAPAAETAVWLEAANARINAAVAAKLNVEPEVRALLVVEPRGFCNAVPPDADGLVEGPLFCTLTAGHPGRHESVWGGSTATWGDTDPWQPCGARALLGQLCCTLPPHGPEHAHEQWVGGTHVASWRTT